METAKNYTWFRVLMVVLMAFNCFDLLSTDFALSSGLAYEANPVMNFVYYKMGRLAFYLIKFFVMGAIIVRLDQNRHVALDRWFGVFCTIGYGALVVHQIHLLIQVFG